MTVRPGVPIKEVVTTFWPTGRVDVVEYLTASVVEETHTKVPQPLPVYVPGNFLVKPYSLTAVNFGGREHTVETSYRRSDGVTFNSKWSGPLDSLQAVLTPCSTIIPNTDPANLRSWRYNKALAKIDGSLFDGGVELGELRETLAMLRDPFSSLRKLLDKDNQRLRRGIMNALRDPKAFMRAVKVQGSVAADTWLEVRYGVRPLISTIQSIIEALAADLQKADDAIHRKVSQTKLGDSKKSTVLLNSRHRVHLDATSTTLVYGKAYYRRFVDQGLDAAIGLAPRQIPEIVWELTRLSFVWDWIIGIGPFLGAIRFKPGISVLGGISGFKTTTTVKVTSERKCVQGVTWAQSSPGEVYTRTVFKRFTEAGAKVPTFLGPANLSVFKMLDSLALIYGSIIRK